MIYLLVILYNIMLLCVLSSYLYAVSSKCIYNPLVTSFRRNISILKMQTSLKYTLLPNFILKKNMFGKHHTVYYW